MITIREITEKVFNTAKNGYNCDEVDDFLDELAKQDTELARQILDLENACKALTSEADDSKAAYAKLAAELADAKRGFAEEKAQLESEKAALQAEIEKLQQEEPAPMYDEAEYFKNLETTLRETLVNAQRKADETIADANKKADEIVAAAEAKASEELSEASENVQKMKKEYSDLQQMGADYVANFKEIVRQQMEQIDGCDLFKK